MNNPRLSAVIVAYNSAPFIADAIESVLAQTRLPDEILVVDDGSTDQTGQIVSQYASSGVRYIYQSNQGCSGSRNTGIRSTSGDFVALLDADDIWLPDKLKHQYEVLLSQPEVALVSGQAWWWNVQTGRRWLLNMGPKKPAQGRRDILIHNWVGNPSMVMVRRSMLEQVGLFDASLRFGDDWDLWIRIVSRFGVVLLPEPLIVYRSHPGNMTHTRQLESLEVDLSISRHSILLYQPVWRRPALLARAWSYYALRRGKYANKQGAPWREQMIYASLGLLAYPYEELSEKVKLLGRVLVGERSYQWFRQAIKRPSNGLHR